jgi:hypothetical protein
MSPDMVNNIVFDLLRDGSHPLPWTPRSIFGEVQFAAWFHRSGEKLAESSGELTELFDILWALIEKEERSEWSELSSRASDPLIPDRQYVPPVTPKKQRANVSNDCDHMILKKRPWSARDKVSRRKRSERSPCNVSHLLFNDSELTWNTQRNKAKNRDIACTRSDEATGPTVPCSVPTQTTGLPPFL